MVSKLASKLSRAKYILTRLRESPPRFLLLKASIELRKKAQRGAVMKAAGAGKRFSDSFEQNLASKRNFGALLRADVIGAVERLGYSEQKLVSALASDFDADHWRCLGFGRYALRPGFWALDDFHDFTWPRDYFADIDYVMADKHCDTKVPWEKSRMQWLSSAALACCVDSDSVATAKRTRKAIALFDNWVSENPYGVGVNWVSSMEVAIRSVNLLLAFSLLEDQLDDETALRLLQCAGEHLHYLKRFPETSDVQGNHYLATALGEYFLEEFGGAQSELSARAFIAACGEQFSTEGLHIEFSPTYHRLSLDMVAIGFALMKRQRAELASELEPLLKRCVDACCILAHHGGELPVFSDNDSGMVLNFQQPARRFGAFGWLPLVGNASTAALRASATLPESIFGAMLAGLAGQAIFTDTSVEAPAQATVEVAPTSTAAPAAVATVLPPFAILEYGTSKAVVRAGTLGLAGRASHDHDDALSFWYSVGGEDLVVEAGCPPYTREKQERSYAIASTSHNLLTAVGQERFAGATGSVTLTLRGGHEGRAVVGVKGGVPELRTELIAGDAVPSTANPARHERVFCFLGDGSLCIQDKATLIDAAAFQLHFHLAPGIGLEDLSVSGKSVAVTQGERHFVFAWSGCEIEDIVIEPYTCHLDYGASVPALCLVVSGPALAEVNITTTISMQSQQGWAAC